MNLKNFFISLGIALNTDLERVVGALVIFLVIVLFILLGKTPLFGLLVGVLGGTDKLLDGVLTPLGKIL